MPKSHLYIFSDGVYEIENASTKTMMSFSDFKNVLVEKTSKLDELFQIAIGIQQSQQFVDDYSMCEILFK